ncbi:MAG: type I-C CRISPR-associated protein Cas7/Csd2 [Verrucomicrobia bacterium]|jgi:CRISPR-associated protein Csd2|nr:type I-C CRISPR-associated protein Cas7/Csd2 [Verrucomicrobiota bacterium]
MKTPDTLLHNLITSPAGKQAADVVSERHDLVLLFDCAKSNPNGDPDTGNMPRVQPDSLKGLVTDVCLKRKIRNFFSLYSPHSLPTSLWVDAQDRQGYSVFIRENAVLQESMEAEDVAVDAERIFNAYTNPEKGKWKRPAKGKAADSEFIARAFRDALCARYVDLRAFGGVVSTEGPLKGSFYGQVRGPLQLTFAESLDKVLPLDATITRCAVASVKEQQQAATSEEEGANRTMGRKHGIDYGLYRCHIHFSPAFAAKTGFSYYDLDNFLFALQHMFDDDHAAGRHLRLVGLVDFEHQSSLGNAPAHKLFELVKVQGVVEQKDSRTVFKSSGSEFPRSLSDYCGGAPDGEMHVRAGKVLFGKNGEGVAVIRARRVVWEIPPAAPTSA